LVNDDPDKKSQIYDSSLWQYNILYQIFYRQVEYQ